RFVHFCQSTTSTPNRAIPMILKLGGEATSVSASPQLPCLPEKLKERTLSIPGSAHHCERQGKDCFRQVAGNCGLAARGPQTRLSYDKMRRTPPHFVYDIFRRSGRFTLSVVVPVGSGKIQRKVVHVRAANHIHRHERFGGEGTHLATFA